MASNIPYEQVSTDAQTALTEFVDEFALALSQAPASGWAEDLGVTRVSRMLKSKFPVPVSAAGYKEFEGDLRYRSIFEKSVTVTPKTWQDGVSELLSIIEAPDFIGWNDEPMRMALAAGSLTNEIIVALLEAATSGAHEWDGESFFDTDHPVNILDTGAGTFSNDFTGAGTNLSIANLKLAKERFRKIKAANGKPMGLRLTHLLVPPALEETAADMLERDLIIESNGANDFGTVRNRHMGTVKVVVADELTSDSQWYGLALNKPGMRPWGLQKRTATPEVRIHGRDSAMFEKELKVGVDAMLDVGGALLLPHCIQFWAGTAP